MIPEVVAAGGDFGEMPEPASVHGCCAGLPFDLVCLKRFT